MVKRFNIRVYGIWLHKEKILVNEELIQGRIVTKFPGGGLEFGEGTIEGLKREWQEELKLDIDVWEHFYTTDFFQPSAFDDSQVISIYYRVSAAQIPEEIRNYVAHERTYWLHLDEINAATFSLPIDKKVGEMLRALRQAGKI